MVPLPEAMPESKFSRSQIDAFATKSSDPPEQLHTHKTRAASTTDALTETSPQINARRPQLNKRKLAICALHNFPYEVI